VLACRHGRAARPQGRAYVDGRHVDRDVLPHRKVGHVSNVNANSGCGLAARSGVRRRLAPRGDLCYGWPQGQA